MHIDHLSQSRQLTHLQDHSFCATASAEANFEPFTLPAVEAEDISVPAAGLTVTRNLRALIYEKKPYADARIALSCAAL